MSGVLAPADRGHVLQWSATLRQTESKEIFGHTNTVQGILSSSQERQMHQPSSLIPQYCVMRYTACNASRLLHKLVLDCCSNFSIHLLSTKHLCCLQASIICAWELPWFPRKVNKDCIDFLMPHIHMSCHAATGAHILLLQSRLKVGAMTIRFIKKFSNNDTYRPPWVGFQTANVCECTS